MLAGDDLAGLEVADTVELDRRQDQVAAVAVVTDQPGCPDSSQAGPEPLVGPEEAGRHPGHGCLPIARQGGDLCGHAGGGVVQAGADRPPSLLHRFELIGKTGDLGIEGIALLEQGQHRVLEVGRPGFEGFEIVGHGLKLARCRDLSAIQAPFHRGGPLLRARQLRLGLRLPAGDLVPFAGHLPELAAGPAGLGVESRQFGAFGEVVDPMATLINSQVEVLNGKQRLELWNAHPELLPPPPLPRFVPGDGVAGAVTGVVDGGVFVVGSGLKAGVGGVSVGGV